MCVLHTTISEVYDRLWVAHEADVATDAGLNIRGLFDGYRWTEDKFHQIERVSTEAGKCGVEKDRAYIERLIKERGGYLRLDETIATFRKEMGNQLHELLRVKGDKGWMPAGNIDTSFSAFDWDLSYEEDTDVVQDYIELKVSLSCPTRIGY